MSENALNRLRLDEGIRDQLKQDVKMEIEIKEPFLKRPLDFFLSTIGLIVSAPLWIVIALAIKLEDGGPVFYTQVRWGKNKKRIKIYKFRTMVPDADKKWGLLDLGENDPRVTRVGSILRATALDEMPQIWSILKGDMSFVGPRALPINAKVNEHDTDLPDEEIPGFDLRSKVRPGLTGIMQIFAPKYVSRAHKFKYDLIYVKNQSVWLDIKLILLSFWITFQGKWEVKEKKIGLGLKKYKYVEGIRIEREKLEVKNRKLIGQILLEARVITETQLNEALKYQKKSRDKIGKCLVRKGYISEPELNYFLNQQQLEAF